MDAVVSTTTESAMQIVGGVVKRHVGYIFNYNEKFEEIKHYIQMLGNAKSRVQNEVTEAKMNAEEIEDDVQEWLKQVDEKIEKYTSFIHDERHEKTRCSFGFFPNNFQLRYRLGRKAAKMVEEINADGLWNKKFDKVSYRVRPSNDAALANIGYESFASRTKTMKMIMQALKDSAINMIGVYGVGGVGKTTLIKEVAKQAKEEKLFNTVVMANITRNPDLKKVQGQIAEMLGMRLEEEAEIVRADRIRKRIIKEKENTLIILDDLWDGLDMNRLGIPCGDDENDIQQLGYYKKMEKQEFSINFRRVEKHEFSNNYKRMEKNILSTDFNKTKKEKLSGDRKGCKILLTSRSKEVICNQMNVQETSTFLVGVIDEKESETLLKRVAGIHVPNSMFDKKANEIAKMCAGLPIALVSIGRALKSKSSFVWDDVCRQIKRQSFTEAHESIEFSIKLSYDHLKNEELKCIFLHCARMGSDALIMDLVKFCVGLGVLQGVHTIGETRYRVNVLIEELKESSLLVESYSTDCFNMHDIVRDVALSISAKEKNVLFMKNGILDEWPHEDEHVKYNAIFLHYCDINDELPESIYCPRLEVLHIDNKNEFLEIPDEFFKDMTRLRVLILTSLNLSCLPSSIKCLKKLRMLCLERCILGNNLSIIGELKKLRILTLSGSNIECLPLEFGHLDKLQLFELSNCSKLRVIPPNIISRMKNLEEYYKRDTLIPWDLEQRNQSENASFSDLRHLNRLRSVEMHIPSIDDFPQNVFFNKLDSYKIVVGQFKVLTLGEVKMPDKYEVVKYLALDERKGIDIHSKKWVKMLFKSVENLLLGELNDVHNVLNELNVEGFPNLKHLCIVNNSGIQHIINPKEQLHLHLLWAFPKLESMCLYKLENLEKICDTQVAEASFCSLKIVKIRTCDKLENLFPFSMVRLLSMLEQVEVCACDSLKEIVSVESQTSTASDNKIEFPQLRFLTLQLLPTFACLYSNDKMSCTAQSLEDQVPNNSKDITTDVGQSATDACVALFNEKVSIPKLELLELSFINIQKIWSDQSLHCFQNLLTLNVRDCGNLKYLLSISMAGCLVNLQNLFVSDSEMMENIFCPEDPKQNVDVFPKLKQMVINCMGKLKTIWRPHIGLNSFYNLDSLDIRECHELVTIFPSYMVQRLHSLQSLIITNCELVESIFDFGNIPQIYDRNETNLHDVFLKELPKLVHVWKDNTSEIKYKNLKTVCVYESPNLKYLFPLSIANDLEKLELLEISSCWGMKEIVAWDKGSDEDAIITFKFPNLNAVSLQQLFELENFYGGAHTLEWPSLKKLLINNCYKLEGFNTEIKNAQGKTIVLDTEKVLYNLELMSMSLSEIEKFQKCVVSVPRMHRLQSLVLLGLKNTEILFSMLHGLPNLEKLTLAGSCLKKIWAPENLISHEKIGVVMQLKELELLSLWCLEEIGFEHDSLLQSIERLVIVQCLKLINLASTSVSFSSLTYLEVGNCRGLRNLMTSSTAKSLVQLTTMKVSFCQTMAEIIEENEEEKVEEVEFRQLKDLELVSLQNLTSFCPSEKCDLKFPLLENLVVSECLKMSKFSKVHNTPNLQKVHVVAGEKDSWYWEGDLNGTLQKLITHQAFFEYSKHLKLVEYPELTGVRHGKPAFPVNFFCSLRKLEFVGASKIQIVIPSYVLPYMKNLEELNVNSCGAAQVIFDIIDTESKNKGTTVFLLKKLTLENLSNLECVWNKNPEGIASFPNLQEVVVEDCGSLVTLFPSSLPRNLAKLKTLQIGECDKLKEIVGKEDATEDGVSKTFEFPSLFSLKFLGMQRLRCFYPGKYHLECPRLESLIVYFCERLKLFTSEFHCHKAVIESDQAITPIMRLQHPLFSVEKVVPKLKELSVNEETIILLSDAHLPQDLLCKLSVLYLCFEDFQNIKGTLPFDFLHKVPNLEKLHVNACYGLMEIFPSEKLQVHDGILAGLKQLTLCHLHELESIGLEHPWVKSYSEKLESLTLLKCTRLEKLVCCAVSFVNLKEFTLSQCERMEYVFTFSTAKSLVQLEKLGIQDCESIKKIVKEEDEDASDEIIFGRLTELMLISLQRLGCFYSGNATLQFSCLQSAAVAECPNMKTFSEGVINAPSFYCVVTSLEDFDCKFDNDINTTMESLFHEQVEKSACDIQHLKFGDHPRLEEIWLGVVPMPSENCFNNLKYLIVVEYESLSHVIPFYLLPLLCNLQEIHVINCQSVKAIFDAKNMGADNKPASQHSLPLKKLILNQLPNLEDIWNLNADEILSLQDLQVQEVYIYNCQRLKSLFRSSTANHLVILDVRDCPRLGELFVEDEATKELIIFHCLTSITLWTLPELKYLFPGKHSLEWPILIHLDIYHCDKLNLFTNEHHGEVADHQLDFSNDQQAIFSVEKIFPNLEHLSLRKEDVTAILHRLFQAETNSQIVIYDMEHQAITKEEAVIRQGQFGANAANLLRNLKTLQLQCYHVEDESNIFSSGLLEKIHSLENLRVLCTSFNEIFSSQKPNADCTKIVSKLKGLHLNTLFKLRSIGLEHSWVEPLLKTLETLEVRVCPFLEILVPSNVSFSNLINLTVAGCHGLVYLLTLSTARSLGLLKNLFVQDCQAIEEIVSKEGDHESNEDEIIFGQLLTLSLTFLPNFVGFHTGTSKLTFPLLYQLNLMGCPQMKYFYRHDVRQFIPWNSATL